MYVDLYLNDTDETGVAGTTYRLGRPHAGGFAKYATHDLEKLRQDLYLALREVEDVLEPRMAWRRITKPDDDAQGG